MLDAVFNHCGSAHPFFQDAVKNGKSSPYYSYFYFLDEPYRDISYLTFAYAKNMPKWNTADPGAREYLIKAARFWVEEFDIDGWRFDVSNEVSHDFWREMRKELKAVKPDILLLGENWDDSWPWLCGGQFDSSMNYTLLGAVSDFAGGRTDAAGFVSALTRGVLTAYPKPVRRVLFNMLESHDTDRLMTACGGNAAAVRLAYLLQMTLGGSPSVYYGGEIGMEGRNADGENRRCMPWDSPVPEERNFRPLLKRLIALRKTHPSFRSADAAFLECSGGLLVFSKEADGERLLVAVNNSGGECEITLPGGPYTDLMTGKDRPGGKAVLPAYGFFLLLCQ
jgi:glycosidase